MSRKLHLGPLFTAFAVALVFGGLAQVHAETSAVMPSDTPRMINDVETVCTGVGANARQDPRWNEYSLKVEVAGKGGQYLGDVKVTVTKQKAEVLNLTCDGPWVLFKLPTGRYQVEASAEGKSVVSAAYVPAAGQGRIILRLPEVGGELTAEKAAPISGF